MPSCHIKTFLWALSRRILIGRQTFTCGGYSFKFSLENIIWCARSAHTSLATPYGNPQLVDKMEWVIWLERQPFRNKIKITQFIWLHFSLKCPHVKLIPWIYTNKAIINKSVVVSAMFYFTNVGPRLQTNNFPMCEKDLLNFSFSQVQLKWNWLGSNAVWTLFDWRVLY